MFSYLRPHHRRTPSNPTSPADHSHSPEPPFHSDHAHPSRPQDTNTPDPPSKNSPPLGLPPIARVTSGESSMEASKQRTFEGGARLQQWEASREYGRSQDTYTYGNHQRMPYTGAQNLEPIGHNAQYPRQTVESQGKSVPTGKRANGAKLPSPTPNQPSSFSSFEPVQSRSSKTRLNLLNPMSLLARRRTSQAIPQLSAESLVSKRGGNDFNATFDPRIRGTVVHDFSAPRPPKRNVSYNDVRGDENSNLRYQRSPNPNKDPNSDEIATSPWGGGNHTPVFTENFDEEQYPAAGPHVRKASDLTDLPLPQPPYARGAHKAMEPVSTSKNTDTMPKALGIPSNAPNQVPMPDRPPPVPPKSERRLSNEPKQVSIDFSPPPPKPLPSKKGRPRNVSEASIKDAAIPKHMKSTSSRFSFDMIGAVEQERLLEDRHRQKALEKQAEPSNNDDGLDEFDDDYDYENMLDDDGLEERIPGVNADLDEEDFFGDDLEEPIPTTGDDYDEALGSSMIHGAELGGFEFQQSMMVSPLSPQTPGMVSTPRDANGEVIGFAITKNSPFLPVLASPTSAVSPMSPLFLQPTDESSNALINGLGLQGLEIEGNADEAPESAQEKAVQSPLVDDDLYFDDGMIAGLEDADAIGEFDESVFDNIDTDEYGRPLNSLPTLYSPPMLTSKPSQSLSNTTLKAEEPKASSDNVSPGTLIQSNVDLAPQPSVLVNQFQNVLVAPHPSLTQDTLAAYQSALAAAAFSAAANGKFRRDSVATNPNPSDDEAQPGLITDSSQTSHYEPFSPSYEFDDDFDYDDLLEDDAIIAAANAEALANDCDGFYGQEFGFYSAPGGQEAEYANGGYFGPRGVEGINRNPSGRVVSREPNLTPITERSEYSNRNSFMSLSAMHGPSSLASPGLSQLAGMLRSPSYDGDMSLDALLKLRRGAWGGSQISLHSSNGSPRSAGGVDEGSPIGQTAPWSQNGFVASPVGNGAPSHRRKNSGISIVSIDASGPPTGIPTEESSMPASPTVTMDVLAPKPSNGSNMDHSDSSGSDHKFVKKHKYSSSAGSISYSKEDDPVAGERWVLERRRTAESGEIELLGREVVQGGRI